MQTSILIKNGITELILDGEAQQALINRTAEMYASKKAEQEELQKTYNVSALATRLGCSRPTVDKLIDSGKIHFTQVGEAKGYRVTEMEVRRFLGDIKE